MTNIKTERRIEYSPTIADIETVIENIDSKIHVLESEKLAAIKILKLLQKGGDHGCHHNDK